LLGIHGRFSKIPVHSFRIASWNSAFVCASATAGSSNNANVAAPMTFLVERIHPTGQWVNGQIKGTWDTQRDRVSVARSTRGEDGRRSDRRHPRASKTVHRPLAAITRDTPEVCTFLEGMIEAVSNHSVREHCKRGRPAAVAASPSRVLEGLDGDEHNRARLSIVRPLDWPIHASD
jgi:hypothetical protein